MANIPGLDGRKTFALGIAGGGFNGYGAFAAGASVRVNENIVTKVSVGSAVDGRAVYGGGATFSW